MNYKLLRVLFGLTGLAVCGYALRCAWFMHFHIGKPDYWTNEWFWKAHLCIPVLFVIRGFIAFAEVKEKQNAERNKPVQ